MNITSSDRTAAAGKAGAEPPAGPAGRMEARAVEVSDDFEPPLLAEPEIFRADIYLLLARLLYTPPGPDVLERAAALKGDATDFGRNLDALAAAARDFSWARVAEEHESLFVGVPVPALTPYASYYLTGSLFGRPLAKLRIDMVQLGLARNEKATEPEDHIGALCETMAALILGTFGDAPASLAVQRLFFEKHVADWAPHFFSDLTAAGPADFFQRVGRLGAAFVEIESRAFRMVA